MIVADSRLLRGNSTTFGHVLCVYPYRRELNDMGFLPPLGLEFIAKVLQPFTQAIELIDLRQEAGRTRDFLRPETEMVCFSVNWDLEAEFLRDEIRSVPAALPTIIGGRHATEDPQRWLTECPNVTAVVRGDGEEAMEEIGRGVPLERIAGVSFRRGAEIVHNPNRVPGPVRDDLFPDRRLRRHPYVATVLGADTGIEMDLLASSRGCPFNCTFCSFNRNPWGTKRAWSARSPESVVAELEQLRAPIVAFTDDLFTLDMDRVGQICDLILARRIHKRYVVNARLEVARRPDILRKMERSGFAMLLLGIESAHDKTLASMHKGFDTAQIREYFKVLRRSRMLLHGYFVLGNIGETADEMRQVPDFAHSLGLDTMALSMLRASPYSGLEELIAANPGYHVSPSGKVFSDGCSLKQLRRMRPRLNLRFYTPAQVLKIVHKGFQNGALRFLPRLAIRLPRLAWHVIGNMRRRAKRRARKLMGQPRALP